jgi:hypothetical protein
MASSEPRQAAQGLRRIVDGFKRHFLMAPSTAELFDVPQVIENVVRLMQSTREVSPLVHQVMILPVFPKRWLTDP